MKRRNTIAALLIGALALASVPARPADDSAAEGVKVPANQRFVLPNGLTVVLVPRKDVPLIAFSARDEKMAYDIFTINVDSGEMVRVTEGHGSNLHPTWAPNGRAVGYESSRGGLWISTADGRTERQVYRGSVKAPNWGPSLTKK